MERDAWLFLIIIFSICAIAYIFDTYYNQSKKFNKESKSKPFISCECRELQTGHQYQVEHKLKCPKFWSLNPNRTKEELMKFEGFA